MASVVDIFNMALGRVGITQEVESLTESTEPRRVCSRWYETIRDQVLRSFPWPFATKFIQLAEVGGASVIGWDYVYSYPSDCLFFRRVVDESLARYPQSVVFMDYAAQYLTPNRIPFNVMLSADAASRWVVTDLAQAYGIYTVKVTNPGVFDPMFTSALAWQLAVNIGPNLLVPSALIKNAQESLLFEMSEAKAQALNEQRADKESESPSISVRW